MFKKSVLASFTVAVLMAVVALLAEGDASAQQPGPTQSATAFPTFTPGPYTPPPPVRTGSPPSGTPTPPPRGETRAEANRRVFATLGPDRKVQLTSNVFAILTLAPHQPGVREVMLYDWPTDSQLFVNLEGNELRRFIESVEGARRLEQVLADPALLARALALGRGTGSAEPSSPPGVWPAAPPGLVGAPTPAISAPAPAPARTGHGPQLR